ncbi:MAG: hypothetical protein DMD40_12650 [Gemmatimonadetes bacterium]|nr:MAG: hypothetical protein DMD40_12650 [Gemmatimonadota bacterium]
MRIPRAHVIGALLLLVAAGCLGGTGSGLVGICCGGNGGNGGNGTPGLGFFVQPNAADVGQAITPPVEVVVRDTLGGTDSSFTASITINLASNPTGATLSGTTVARPVNGIASFSNLAIDKAGTYTLQASASGVSVTSNGFTINAP